MRGCIFAYTLSVVEFQMTCVVDIFDTGLSAILLQPARHNIFRHIQRRRSLFQSSAKGVITVILPLQRFDLVSIRCLQLFGGGHTSCARRQTILLEPRLQDAIIVRAVLRRAGRAGAMRAIVRAYFMLCLLYNARPLGLYVEFNGYLMARQAVFHALYDTV